MDWPTALDGIARLLVLAGQDVVARIQAPKNKQVEAEKLGFKPLMYLYLYLCGWLGNGQRADGVGGLLLAW